MQDSKPRKRYRLLSLQKSILEELFYILDKDDSGKIFTKDLRIALFSIGIYWKKSKIDEFILNVEAAAKGSQYIDYTLFHEKFSSLLDLKPDNGQDSAFHVFDANNSGSIDLDNLIYSMETIGIFRLNGRRSYNFRRYDSFIEKFKYKR